MQKIFSISFLGRYPFPASNRKHLSSSCLRPRPPPLSQADEPDTGKSPLNAAASYHSPYAIQLDELEKAKLEFESAGQPTSHNWDDGITYSGDVPLLGTNVPELGVDVLFSGFTREKIIEASGEIVTGGGLVAKDEGKLHAFATRPRGPARRRLLSTREREKKKRKATDTRRKKRRSKRKSDEAKRDSKRKAYADSSRKNREKKKETKKEEDDDDGDDEGLEGFPWILF